MKFPYVSEIKEGREMATSFSGYNHTNKCADGQFYDMNNLESDKYPFLGVKSKKTTYNTGVLGADKKSFAFIGSDGNLYVENEMYPIGLEESYERDVVRMGSYVCIFPDNKYVNVDNYEGLKDIEVDKDYKVYAANTSDIIQFAQCDADLNVIHARLNSYYESHTPSDGDYKIDTEGDTSTVSKYSSASSMWMPVSNLYIRIRIESTSTDVFQPFNDGDGVEIGFDFDYPQTTSGDGFKTKTENNEEVIYDDAYDALKKIFINEDGTNNVVIKKRTETNRNIYIPGILYVGSKGSNFYKGNDTTVYQFPRCHITVKRVVPLMDFVIECQNRLWGCDANGREIYASKLGDPTNWQCFSGISTDSYAASIGSDGVFTGAVSYKGYPMFFKAGSVIRVAISSQGAHQVKEIDLNGVAHDSHKSLTEIGGLLYYNSPSGVCVFDGNSVTNISDALGAVTYTKAVGGTINGKYYIELYTSYNKSNRFIYDTSTGIWTKEDGILADGFIYNEFSNGGSYEHINELYAYNSTSIEVLEGNLKKIEFYDWDDSTTKTTFTPTTGGKVDWYLESGTYGFTSPDKKNLSRINVRMRLENDSNVSFQIKYDSYGDFQTVWQMYGRGTKTFTIPMKPHRCDHYKYRLVGKGDAEIISITRTYTEGSDM